MRLIDYLPKGVQVIHETMTAGSGNIPVERVLYIQDDELVFGYTYLDSAHNRCSRFIRFTESEKKALMKDAVCNHGKATGVQLHAISAIDQLHAMIQGEYASLVKELASSTALELEDYILDAVATPSPDKLTELAFLVRAMALFCLSEMMDRDLLPSEERHDEEEPNEGP